MLLLILVPTFEYNLTFFQKSCFWGFSWIEPHFLVKKSTFFRDFLNWTSPKNPYWKIEPRGYTRADTVYYEKNHIQLIIIHVHTITALMLPRGSIFQYGFLGGGQFKKSLKKWTFWSKSGGLIKKKSKNWTFQTIWGSTQDLEFKSEVALKQMG